MKFLKTLIISILAIANIGIATAAPTNQQLTALSNELKLLVYAAEVDEKCALLGSASRKAANLRHFEILNIFTKLGVANEVFGQQAAPIMKFIKDKDCATLEATAATKSVRDHADLLAAKSLFVWKILIDNHGDKTTPLCQSAPNRPIRENIKSQTHIFDRLYKLSDIDLNILKKQAKSDLKWLNHYCFDKNSINGFAFSNTPFMKVFDVVTLRNSYLEYAARADFMTYTLKNYNMDVFRGHYKLDKEKLYIPWAARAHINVEENIHLGFMDDWRFTVSIGSDAKKRDKVKSITLKSPKTGQTWVLDRNGDFNSGPDAIQFSMDAAQSKQIYIELLKLNTIFLEIPQFSPFQFQSGTSWSKARVWSFAPRIKYEGDLG